MSLKTCLLQETVLNKESEMAISMGLMCSIISLEKNIIVVVIIIIIIIYFIFIIIIIIIIAARIRIIIILVMRLNGGRFSY